MTGPAPDAPLAGIRVVDFSELLPGPFLSQALVEMGAAVTKVERPPHGDPLRRSSPGLFGLVNRGKRSVALNLKDEADRDRALALAADADVMIEGFRPGVMTRLGLGYETVKARNPGIIYLSLSGYGQTGPMVSAPGHDLNYLALAGITALCGTPNGPPDHTFGLPVADLGGALYALCAVQTALFQRERGGGGQWLDVSLTDCLAHWVNARRGPFNHGNVHDPQQQRRIALVRPAYGVFACTDGAVSIAALEGHFWAALVTALDLQRFAGPDYAALGTRRAEAEAINAAIAESLAALSRADALALLTRHDVPASPVLSVDEAAASDHFAARGLIAETETGPVTPFPVRFTGMPATPTSAPGLDADGVVALSAHR